MENHMPLRLIQPASPVVLLSPKQMAEADRLAIESGVDGVTLMKNAGYAVAREIEKHWTKRNVVVLCGPGNNGGDGFVIARYLQAAKWPVTVALSHDISKLTGDVAQAASLWQKSKVLDMNPACLDDAELVVDAVFGAGLNRDFEGPSVEVLKAASEAGLPIVAVDIPSGVDGATGSVRGTAVAADLTVTFFRMKPGHKLLPGRDLCGALVVADIGISDDVCRKIGAQNWVNQPSLWSLPVLTANDHKYTRGHVLIVGGEMTGASRLASRAARRVGVGLATVLCPEYAFSVYAADAPGAIVIPVQNDGEDTAFKVTLRDERRNVILIGPGHGVNDLLKRRILDVLKTGRGCVLDADALDVFSDTPDELFNAIQGPTILTPHGGEFQKLFPDLKSDRLTNVCAAAKRSGAIVVLKGSDTVIADPEGRAVINDNAPPTLATAGAGDVLAGLIAGLLAQGMRPMAAAAAGVWIHGDAARCFGPGLIAEDLPEIVPKVLRNLIECDK